MGFTTRQRELSKAHHKAWLTYNADRTDSNYSAWKRAEKAWKAEARRQQERELLDGE